MPRVLIKRCKLCSEKKEIYYHMAGNVFEKKIETVITNITNIDLQKYVIDKCEFCYDCVLAIFHAESIVFKIRSMISKLRIKREYKPRTPRPRKPYVSPEKSTMTLDATENNDQSVLNESNESSKSEDEEEEDETSKVNGFIDNEVQEVKKTPKKEIMNTTPKIQSSEKQLQTSDKSNVDSLKKNVSLIEKKSEINSKLFKTPEKQLQQSSTKKVVNKTKEKEQPISYCLNSDDSDTERLVHLPKLFKSPELNTSKNELKRRKSVCQDNNSPAFGFKKISDSVVTPKNNTSNHSQEVSENDVLNKVSKKKRTREASMNESAENTVLSDFSELINLSASMNENTKKPKKECNNCGKLFKSKKKYDKHILKNECVKLE